MRYRCLVVDHDDTVVNSTATVHYPCFCEYMRVHFPRVRMTLNEYLIKNFDPGVYSLFHDIVGMTEEQMKDEEAFWNAYVKSHVPEAFPGIRELLEEQKAAGGLVCVISHSLKENILRDYRENGLPEPDAVYGWEVPKAQRKPEPDCLFDLMRRFGVRPEEMVVLDDLKPGLDMADAAGVAFAPAGWAYDVPEIQDYLRERCGRVFTSVEEFRRFQFED